jgi:tol-pal system protein YbgF
MRRLVLVILLLGLVAPARAANKDIERLQIQIATLQSQVADVLRAVEEGQKELKRLTELLAQQNASFNKAVMDQKVQMETVQTAMREMQERVAEVGERVEAARTAAAAMPVDPALGLPAPAGPAPPGAAPGPAAGAPGSSTPPAAPAGAPPPAPRELYSQAYADFARGNYDLAIMGFTEYLKAYPGTDFSDNAQYWIGECLYGKQKYQEAVEAWNVLFRDYPSSDKLPDARVKKGMALERLGRRSQALVEYRYVVDRFPNSSAARIARERINP